MRQTTSSLVVFAFGLTDECSLSLYLNNAISWQKLTFNIMQRVWLLLLLTAALLAGGCDNSDHPEPAKTATVALEIMPTVGDAAFAEDMVYRSPTGIDYQFTRYRFLLSDLRLVRADGEEEVLAEDLFVDFFDNELRYDLGRIEGLTLTVPITLPAGVDAQEYVGLRFGIGVPQSRNNNDPALQEPDHPLSFNRGMHWSWNSGYIFMQIEGEYDTTAQSSGNLGGNFVYHPGRNELFREQDLSGAITLTADQTTPATLKMDLSRTFFRDDDQIDLAVDNFTHSTPPDGLLLAERVMDNIVAGAFSFMP